MSEAIDKVERIIGRMYTAFILRDLTFFVSGGLVIMAGANNTIDEWGLLLCKISDHLWLAIIPFLAISYVLGVILQEAARIPLEYLSKKWIKCKIGKEESTDELVARLEKIYQKGFEEETKFGIERILFLKQIGSTQFSSIAIIMLIVCLRDVQVEWKVKFLVDGYLLLCAWMYVDKSRQQEQILRSLEKDNCKDHLI